MTYYQRPLLNRWIYFPFKMPAIFIWARAQMVLNILQKVFYDEFLFSHVLEILQLMNDLAKRAANQISVRFGINCELGRIKCDLRAAAQELLVRVHAKSR
ncbi:hypothetical protein FJ987_23465 [Mesorhizobium sp. CU2]|uniref:hypothetical protein n=1 Tax=unclassified Mesorhizobium TaxID=325217 RepID=UPI0011292606|nr:MULTISPECIES: hypothetical protein [unclassified Mesorhizobium]TPN88486.1 hypothetical protein FJ988_05410 [Mesorhizobium sp. CU3]TPO08200.1 hypothetical protein FJ987_23465 [Mesorhizobium sp. CU2]